MSDTTPDHDTQSEVLNAAADTSTPPEPPKQPDPEPEKQTKAESKKAVDKALAAAAKAAKVDAAEVLSFKDYDDKTVVVTRSGQKITVQK